MFATRALPVSRWSLGCLLISGLFLTLSCGDDDDPTNPLDDGVLEVPGEFAGLREALQAAPNGSTIRIDAVSMDVDSAVVVDADRQNITIVGRTDQDAARPVLVFDAAGLVAIEVKSGAVGIALVGLELKGAFRVGARLNGDGGRIEDCRIEGAQQYAVSTTAPAAGVEVRNNVLVGSGLFGVHCLSGSSPQVIGNTIVDTGDCGIFTNMASPSCERNLIARSANYGIACFGSPEPSLDCNDIFESVTSHYNSGCTPGAGDFHEDPRFCGGTEFTLRTDSPCLDVDGCGRVGALGVGCEP